MEASLNNLPQGSAYCEALTYKENEELLQCTSDIYKTLLKYEARWKDIARDPLYLADEALLERNLRLESGVDKEIKLLESLPEFFINGKSNKTLAKKRLKHWKQYEYPHSEMVRKYHELNREAKICIKNINKINSKRPRYEQLTQLSKSQICATLSNSIIKLFDTYAITLSYSKHLFTFYKDGESTIVISTEPNTKIIGLIHIGSRNLYIRDLHFYTDIISLILYISEKGIDSFLTNKCNIVPKKGKRKRCI